MEKKKMNFQESQQVELKQIWKDEYLKTICAFANTDGGEFYIGVADDKIIFTNGATLSPEVPIEKFKQDHLSKPFNPLIANMFYKAGFVESWGKGINNIISDCLEMNLPEPDYKYTQKAVQVILHKTTHKTTQKTTKAMILELLKEENKLTRDTLSQMIGVSSNAIKQHLAHLQTEGLLKRVGGRKNGHWEVLNDKNMQEDEL